MICTTLAPNTSWPTFTAPTPKPPRRPKQANGIHRQRISEHIQTFGPCSTAQIKLRTGIAGGQVSHSLAQLREEGLIRKTYAGVHPRNGQRYFLIEWLGEKT